MTEQPAEPRTEQAWLGNERPRKQRPAPEAPLQAYLPAGHRIKLPCGTTYDQAYALNLLQETLKAEADFIAAEREMAAAEDTLKIARAGAAAKECMARDRREELTAFIRKQAEL